MFKKKAILQYESAIEVYPNIITPAKNHIPGWYKKMSAWENNKIFDINKNGFPKTLKKCIPFLDSFTTGYMIVLPYDLYVTNNNGIPYLSWTQQIELPPSWREQVSNINLVPEGHYPCEYVWKTNVANMVFPGYSILLTHPLNRYDLPFTTLSGVVDGGTIMHPEGSIPFFIKKEFEGIIPQGTPIAQLIPFRQEKWSSNIKNGLVKKGKNQMTMSNLVISDWYKKTFWTRKDYK